MTKLETVRCVAKWGRAERVCEDAIALAREYGATDDQAAALAWHYVIALQEWRSAHMESLGDEAADRSQEAQLQNSGRKNAY